MRMRDRNPEISLMPEFDSEEAFNASFAKEAAVAPYRDSQGRLVLDDIHDLPKVVEKVFAEPFVAYLVQARQHPDAFSADPSCWESVCKNLMAAV